MTEVTLKSVVQSKIDKNWEEIFNNQIAKRFQENLDTDEARTQVLAADVNIKAAMARIEFLNTMLEENA